MAQGQAQFETVIGVGKSYVARALADLLEGTLPEGVDIIIRRVGGPGGPIAAARRSPEASTDPRQLARELVEGLAIPARVGGYRCLIEGALLLAAQPDRKLVTDLYPAIARACGFTAEQAERNMRHAIKVAYDTGPDRFWHTLGVRVGSQFFDRPTCGEVLTRLATLLRRRCGIV